MIRDTPYVRGAEKLGRKIQTIKDGLGFAAMQSSLEGLLLARTLRRFDQEVDPGYKPWKPLSPQTHGAGRRKMLNKTGRLRKSIKVIRGGLGTIFTNTGAGFRIGIKEPEIVKYAAPQNRGIPGKIPARRFLGIGARDVKSVDTFLRRRADKVMQE